VVLHRPRDELSAVEAAELLGHVPLLQALRSVHLDALAAIVTPKRVDAGEPIVRAGRPAPGLVVLRGGRASGGGLELGPGDCLEEMAALGPRVAQDTVVAVEPTEYFVLPAREVHDAVRRDPELGIALLKDVATRAPTGGDDLSEQLLRYAADVRDSFRESERRQEALRRSVLGAVRGLVHLAEAKHPWSRGHASRTAHLARALANKLGWPEDDVNNAALGGLLHDVGYVVVESAVLRKEGPLDEAEQRQIRSHPTIGARIIEHIDFLKPVVPFVLCHHERYDGHGYPRGLAGKAIPQEGRLMAAVELYETLCMSQVGPAVAPDPRQLARLLRAEIGTQLDRDIASALAAMVESGWEPGG
jgi:putative nucleotidyltransferase with HDIG domain